MTLPVDETKLDASRGAVRVRSASMEVTGGPDKGRSARIEQPVFIVGKGDAADLRLTDSTISREHLRVSLLPEGLLLRDEGSKNGTWIGSVRVRELVATSDVALQLGTTPVLLRLDATTFDLPVSGQARFGAAVGVSLAMRHLFDTLKRVSSTDVSVLLEGESGVGKEVLARAIHDESARAGKPFVVLDCGAIPPTLIESDLFGHERGAFTGATESRKGVFEQADGGTLFIDEIGELPLDLQPRLLRALEAREIRPVGASGTRSVNVRVVAATNRHLQEAVERSAFRRDLFYRLVVARIVVPPLRDRAEDVIPIAQAFYKTLAADPNAELPADLCAMLRSYAWPGNVRELRNAVERYAALGARDARTLFDAAAPASERDMDDLARLPFHEARRIALERFEREYLPRVLRRAGGVVTRAAELAEVARPSFHRMLVRARVRDDAAGEND